MHVVTDLPAPTRDIKLSLADQDPFAIAPHGDRLFVQRIEIADEVKVGAHTLHVARAGQTSKDEQHDRGWWAGVVIHVGNGHRLNAADTPVRMKVGPDVKQPRPDGIPFAVDPDAQEAVILVPARVQMPFSRGNVVAIERYAGRDANFGGREYVSIEQEDILWTFCDLFFHLTNDGWVQVPIEALRAARAAAQAPQTASGADG